MKPVRLYTSALLISSAITDEEYEAAKKKLLAAEKNYPADDSCGSHPINPVLALRTYS